MTIAAFAWAVLLLSGERRQLSRWGALPVTVIAAGIVPVVLWVSGSTLVRLYDGQTPHPEPMWWIAEAAAVVTVLSFPRVAAQAAWVIAPALAIMAGLGPAPIGWMGLAVAGLVAFAALALAIIGVARRWFAPLLATALTAVLLAVGQIVVHDALVPKWVAFALVGGVILALGLVAERISKMR